MKCVTEVFSRVTGFFRPVQDWNPGKDAEFKDRGKFEVKDKDAEMYPEIERDGFK